MTSPHVLPTPAAPGPADDPAEAAASDRLIPPQPQRPQPSAGGQPRIAVLDGLRLVAALAVVGYHYLAPTGEDVWGASTARLFPTLHRLAGYGWLGVLLFFMISGFVICLSSWGRTPQDFWRSRVLRLFPLYWFSVVLVTVFSRSVDLRPGDPVIGLKQMLTNLTMMQEALHVGDVDIVYWTLWAELRFYLLFSVVVWLGTNYRRVAAFCWVWAIASVLTPSSGIPLLDTLVDPPFAPLFIAGTTFYLLRVNGRLTGELLGLLVFSWLLVQYHMPAIVKMEGAGTWSLSMVAVTGMYAVMYLIATRRLDRIRWRWLPVAGAISYPLYLLHRTIGVRIIRMEHTALSAPVLLAVVVLGMTAAAWLVHRLVERPVVGWLRRLAR